MCICFVFCVFQSFIYEMDSEIVTVRTLYTVCSRPWTINIKHVNKTYINVYVLVHSTAQHNN